MSFSEFFHLEINLYTLLPLFVGILMFALGIITLIKDRISRASLAFLLVTLSILIWLGAYAFLYSATDKRMALIWAKIEHLGVVFIPSAFFIFTLVIIRRFRHLKIFAWSAFSLSTAFCALLLFTPYFIKDVSLFFWGYYASYGNFGYLFIIYLSIYMLFSLVLLYNIFQHTTSKRERSRIKGIFLGVSIGLIGAVDFFPACGVNRYPFGYIPMLICIVILGITILRFRFLDLTPSYAATHILNTMQDSILVVDAEKQIWVTNNAVNKMLGYKEDELKGNNLSTIFKITGEIFPEKLELGWVLHETEMSWRKKTGDLVDVSVSASIITDRNEFPSGIVLAAADITERKKARQELIRAKEDAEQASQAKSEFLANMSHEIRTPLNAVIGFSDLLTETSLDNLQKDYIITINESGKLLLSLIDNILDLSKIEAKQIDLESIDFNLKNLVENVMKIAGTKIAGKEIELYHDFQPDMSLNFKGDPTRIRQVLMNLLSNAIKFTEKGEIKVKVGLDTSRTQERSQSEGTRNVQITVKDSGIGIHPEKQKTIFETFAQADTSTTRKYGGTGLGLTIARALANKMEGDILVRSKEGKGSEFIFSVKLKESDLSSREDIFPIRDEELKGKKVIIVDDNQNAIRIIKAFCLKADMLVCSQAKSVAEGMKWLQAQDELPDVIISDIMMPEIDGYMFAEKLRKIRRFQDIKLVALSSDARPGSARKAKESGFDAFAAKPIFEKSFIKILKTVLGDNRSRGQIITRHLAEELSLKGIRVLVAEDNAVNQKLIGVLLKKLGCKVEIVENGKYAIEAAAQKSFDVCLMDLQMPVMGGIEATKKIRESGNNKMPILALTAATTKQDKEISMSAGMNDFLTKPVSAVKLEEKLRKWSIHNL